MIDRTRIADENELRPLAGTSPTSPTPLDVVGRSGIDADAVIEEVARFSRGRAVVGRRHGRHALRSLPDRWRAARHDEKVDDVAALNALTGANRTISLHVPWDDPRRPAKACARTPRSRASGSTP